MIVEIIPDSNSFLGKKLSIKGTKDEIKEFKKLVCIENFLNPDPLHYNKVTDKLGILPYRTTVEFEVIYP